MSAPTSPQAPQTVDLYFDYLSPYAYFAWMHARPRLIEAGARVVPRPVLLAALLEHGGQLGPAEIPAKRAFIIRDTLRYASRHGLPLAWPKTHPFVPLTALRLSLSEVAGDDQERVIDAVWRGGWGRGGELGDPDGLAEILDREGLDGRARVEATRDPAVKAALRRDTEAAIARGVFGVPTFAIGDELFWGHDRLDDVCDHLRGQDPLQRDDLRALAATVTAQPPGVTRSRSR